MSLQSLWVDIYLDLALLAAVGKRSLCALNGGELGPDGVLAHVKELLLAESSAGEAEHQHRNAGGVVLDDEWRRCAWGKLAQLDLRNGCDLGDGAGDIGVRLEEDLDDGDARERSATRCARCRLRWLSCRVRY